MQVCPLTELYRCTIGKIGIFYIQLPIVIIAVLFGALLMWRPKKIIEIQIAIYRPLNWKIEPISMDKEIRNTRIMGTVVFILGIITLIYVIMQQF